MKKIQWLAILLFAFSALVNAQTRLLTIDDIFSPDPKVRVKFSGDPVSVQWSADGKSFKQVVDGKLMRIDALTGFVRPYFDSESFIAALVRAGIKADEAGAMAASPSLHFSPDESAILVNSQNDLWLYMLQGAVLKRLTNDRDDEKEADFSPDGTRVSFVRNNDLYALDIAKGNERKLTNDGRLGEHPIYNGYLDWVYEEELYGRGNKRGYWWSPDSRCIAFLRLDETPVPKFMIANDVPTGQLIENTDYPKAGDPNPLVRLGVAEVSKPSLNGGRTRKSGDPPSLIRVGANTWFIDSSAYKPDDMLIARVAWSPDSRAVVFQALNREQTFLDLNAATLDGHVRKLITETTPTWVEVYGNPLFLKDGNAVWASARNGWKHLYLHDNKGDLVRPLTAGHWEVRSVYGIDEQNGWVYFSATKDSPIAENVYRVKLTGGEPERITKGNGWHSAAFNKTFTHFVEIWSDANTPPQTRLFRADGTLERPINENKVDAMKQYRLSRAEFLNVPTRDGFTMEAMMIKPPDFDPSKKYPVFEFTYSGPHTQSVLNRWAGNRGMWFQMLAEKGYIVWVCDNRTASGKGEESVWPIYKNMYQLELRDLEDGVNYLKGLPYVDGSRIGLHGWSYGGSMTSYALTHSHLWKIGIAGGTVSDEHLYDSIYTERYMLMPQHNPDGYDSSSVVKSAQNLTGKLLLIHGAMDDNVHMQNTTQLIYALQKAGKQFDLMIYPTQRHGVTDPAQVRHLYALMTDYILKNL